MITDCFLCNQNVKLTYYDDINFYAMLGIGPIIEGYSLIVTKKHIPSMLDLSDDLGKELTKVTSNIKKILLDKFGKCIITEHGRVPPCEIEELDKHEAHCYHAHRLVFPINIDLTDSFTRHNLKVYNFNSFSEALEKFRYKDEYLYFEKFDGTCIIAPTRNKIARQFFRYEIAEKIGKPELANWKRYPELKAVASTLDKLLK